MKKIALILALALAVSLAACSKKAEEAPEETPVDGEQQEEVTPEVGDETPAEVAPTIGTLTVPKIYKNEYLGITAKFPNAGDNKWDCETNEENLATNGFTKKADGNYEAQMKKADSIQDFYAKSNKNAVVSVILDNIAVPATDDKMSESDYVAATIAALPTSLAKQGVFDAEIDTAEVNFAGQQREAITVTGSRNGIKMYQKQVIYKQDDYMVVVTVTTSTNDDTTSILNLFTAVK